MMLTESQIRHHLRQMDQQEAQFGKFAHQLMLISHNNSMAYGDPDKVKEIVAGLVELKNLVMQHRNIVEAMGSVQPMARDKTNATVLGLLGNIKGKRKAMLSRLDGLIAQIQELLRTAGSGNSSVSSRLTVAMARHLDNHSDKKDFGGPDGFLIAIFVLIAAVKAWVRPSER